MSALAAPPRRMRTAPVVRRIWQLDGLVTYLECGAICEVVGISYKTVMRWAEMGCIRYTDALRGVRNYALVDCARLKAMTVTESRALGIKRHPERDIIIEKAWSDRAQQQTKPQAKADRDEWCTRDACYVIEAVNRGDTLTEIALHLGRTYGSIANRVFILRRDGELPPVDRPGDEWYGMARGMLTAEEQAMLDAV